MQLTQTELVHVYSIVCCFLMRQKPSKSNLHITYTITFHALMQHGCSEKGKLRCWFQQCCGHAFVCFCFAITETKHNFLIYAFLFVDFLRQLSLVGEKVTGCFHALQGLEHVCVGRAFPLFGHPAVTALWIFEPL